MERQHNLCRNFARFTWTLIAYELKKKNSVQKEPIKMEKTCLFPFLAFWYEGVDKGLGLANKVGLK